MNSGTITQIIGPVADITFKDDKSVPQVKNALQVVKENGEVISTQIININKFRAQD